MAVSLPVVNLAEAKFECTFGRGCDGVCCHNGRPPIFEEEAELYRTHLARFLPHMRPEARAVALKEGFLSNRYKLELPMLRVVDHWCIFFNQGCVLHKVGEMEGDKFRYKPSSCIIFPLARDAQDRWYIRQWGYNNEQWDLHCLNPQATTVPAAESLRDEIDLARKYDLEAGAEETLTRESA
jgi:hypothetical protein